MSIALSDCFMENYLSSPLDYLLRLNFPNGNCPHCNEPIFLELTLDTLHCNNEDCEGRITANLFKLCLDVGVEECSYALCAEATKAYGIQEPLEVLLLDLDNSREDYAEVNFLLVQLQVQLTQCVQSPAHIIKYCYIPHVSILSPTLFGGYPSLQQFYEELDFGEVSYIIHKLGLTDDLAIFATVLYQTLINHKDRLLQVEQLYRDNYILADPIYLYVTDVTPYINPLDTLHSLRLKFPSLSFVHQGLLTPLTQYYVSSDTPTKEQQQFCEAHNIEHLFIYELEQALEELI